MDRIKEIKNAAGATVNDVVMAACAGALRNYLDDRVELPDDPLIGMVPVSIRGADDGVGGNKVSAMLAALPTQLEDPVERLAVTRQATMIAKAQQAFIPQGSE